MGRHRLRRNLHEIHRDDQAPGHVTVNNPEPTPTLRRSRPAWLRVAVLVIAMKVVLFLAVFLSLHLLPPIFDGENYLRRFHWPADETPSQTWMLKTWDSAHYLYLSEAGYAEARGSAAFYPLWPLVIRVFRPLFGSSLLAGLILANIFSVLGWTVFHRFSAHVADEKTADTSLLLGLAFPAALYFCFPYSESLFFLVTVSVFYLVARNRLAAAAMISILAPITRAVGIFVFIPIAWRAFTDWRSGKRPVWHLGLAFAPAIGIFLALGLVWIDTGNFLAGFDAQAYFAAQPSIMKMFHPIEFFKTFVDVWGITGVLHSGLDRLFFVGMLIGLVMTARFEKTIGPMTLYSTLLVVVPAVTVSFMSFMRYAAVVFPVFLSAGWLLTTPSRREFRWIALTLSLMLQFFFLLRHVNVHWVA